MKEEWIQTELMPKSFKVFNVDRTKNEKVMQFALQELEININRYIDKINTVVTDINNTDIFLEYNQLVKHNSEVNWNKGIIQFTRCLKKCKI